MTYDASGLVLVATHRDRFHDATDTGALGNPSSSSGTAKARVSYSGYYYDAGDRATAVVDVGTNGGSAWSRPGSVPARSDTVLVSSVTYDSAGLTYETTDPKGIVARTLYDDVGRTTKTIEHYVDGTVGDDNDKTTEYAYGPAGMTSLTAKLTGGGGQTTEWVYGVSSGSGITSNDIVGATKWPDPSSGSASSGEQETVTVNALGQPLTMTDRNGNVHTLTYDILGRVTVDTVTTLGSGVDGSVRRVETAYDSQGNAYLLTSYDATTSGNIVTQIQRAFNGLGQMTREWQSHGGAVNTSTTPSVQYAYSEMPSGANHSRLTSITYPDGYVLTYNYASGLNGDISRLSSLSDASGTLESYDYLGLGTVVRRGRTQAGGVSMHLRDAFDGVGPGEAGDQYDGLDRFGRTTLVHWLRGDDDTVLDEFAYTYDRNSNRLTKDNAVNSDFDEAYTYDNLNQLTGFDRNSGDRTQAWDFDALGNWDSLTTDGGSPQTRTHNKQNEITAVSGATSPTFDANGNMTTDETGKQYVYDAWNRLKVVKNSGGTTLKTYVYDALNRRVAETAGGATTDLYYSANWQVLEERDAARANDVKARYVWSPVYVDAMILRDRDTADDGTLEERLWVQQDANWNVTALVDANGDVVERYVYDPYGVATVLDETWSVIGSSAYGWLHLHQGGRLDATSGLYHFRNRDYSPTLGRWVTMDPITYDSGEINLYLYIGNSVINGLDFSGNIVVFFKGYGGPGGSSSSSGESSGSSGKSSVVSGRSTSESSQSRSSNSNPSGSSLPGGSSASSGAGRSSSSGPDDKSSGPYPLYNFADKKYEYDQVNSAVKHIISVVGNDPKHCKEPIIIIGHSWGGDSAIRAAKQLIAKGYKVDLMVTLDPVVHTAWSLVDPVETTKPEGVNIAWNYYQRKDRPMGSSMPNADINELDYEGTIRGSDGKLKKGVAVHTEIDDVTEIATKVNKKVQELNKQYGKK